MDTKEKKRPAAAGTRSRGTGRKKKKGGLFAMGSKPSEPVRKRPRPVPEAVEAPAVPTEEEVFLLPAEEIIPVEELPEQVFQPEQAEQPRVRTAEDNQRSERRRRSAKRAKARQEEAKRAKRRPNVTYTQPVPFQLQKLLVQLSAVVAVVLAVVMGLSVFFKVENVVVYGNSAYSAWTIQEASGIEGGENLLTFGSTRACGKITTALPYVDTVRIGIKLPDTVNIYIKELDVVYAVKSGAGDWWLMTSGGKIVEKIDAGLAGSYTKVLGVEVDDPTVGAQAKAVEVLIPVTQETGAAGETVSTEPVFTITGADRLRAALKILDALELNEIVGEAASIDVSSLNALELTYGTRYQVKLGDSNDMEKKISAMKQAVAQLNDYQKGILDVSFTTWTDRPGYTPVE